MTQPLTSIEICAGAGGNASTVHTSKMVHYAPRCSANAPYARLPITQTDG